MGITCLCASLSNHKRIELLSPSRRTYQALPLQLRDSTIELIVQIARDLAKALRSLMVLAPISFV